MISSLLHLVGLRPRVYYTLTNFRGGGGQGPLGPPPQYANDTYIHTHTNSTYRPISQTMFMLSIAINRAEHVCATVIIKHNYIMLMCNHKLVINIMLCLLNSTGHISVKVYDRKGKSWAENRTTGLSLYVQALYRLSYQAYTILSFKF